jgi:short-subunit dehydrogenase
MEIQGRVVFITGASEGIGAACAAEFRRRGGRLVLMARSEQNLRRIAQPEDVIAPGDVTLDEHRRHAIGLALDRFGRIDILINNAGLGVAEPSWRAPMEDIRYMFEVNFFAALEMARLVVPHMRERASGMIVNVGSIAGSVALPWFTAYSATKYALDALTAGLRMELRSSGIHAMLVCPGFVATAFHQHVRGGPPPGAARRGRPAEITAEQCARTIAAGVERNARTIVTPGIGRLLIFAWRWFPAITERVLLSKQGMES